MKDVEWESRLKASIERYMKENLADYKIVCIAYILGLLNEMSGDDYSDDFVEQ